MFTETLQSESLITTAGFRQWKWPPDQSEVRESLGGVSASTPHSEYRPSDKCKLVILTLEVCSTQGVVCDFIRKPGRSGALKFRPEVFSALSYLQLHHLLVFVTALGTEGLKEVIDILEEESIVPDGVYRIDRPGTPRIDWGLDYSPIYHDFHLPSRNCLIVSPLSLDFSEHPHLTHGSSILRSYAEALPIPTLQHPTPPITVLLPHLSVYDTGSSSMILLSLLLNAMGDRFDSGYLALSFDWIHKIPEFPYKRLWLSTFTAKEQHQIYSSLQPGEKNDPARILVVKRKHVKGNFEVGFRRGKTPARGTAGGNASGI